MGLILLIAATLMTSVAGYHYVAHTDSDAAIQAAYYLGQSAGMGDADAHVKFDERFHGDRDARLAYEHGMMSVESESTDDTAIH